MKRYILLLITLLMTVSSYVHAGIGEDMQDFFDKSGGNYTPPAVIQDQQAGHVSFGGYYRPNRSVNIQPFQVKAPSLKIGACGDISMSLGGLSFLGGDLTGAFKNIMTSAVSYAMLLALETQFPQIAANIKQLQSYANQINAIGINSCEAGTALVGALWPQKTEASQMICRTQAASDGAMSDYIKGRHGCSDPATYNTEIEKADRKTPQTLKDEYNIAWQVLANHPLFTGGQNNELRYFFMSMTGTVIAKKGSDGEIKLDRKESLAKNTEFIKALLKEGGKQPEIYYCDGTHTGEHKCLDVKTKTMTLAPQNTFKSQIETLLLSMQHKVRNDGGKDADKTFSPAEISLINKTHIPILKMINVMSASKNGASPMLLTGYTEEIAIDILCKYITEILDIADHNANLIRGIQTQVEDLDKFIANLAEVRKIVHGYEIRAQTKVARLFQLEQKLHMLEQDIYSSMRLQLK